MAEAKLNQLDTVIISHYSDKHAMAFMPKDINQKDQYLGDYFVRLGLLWWSNTEDAINQLMKELTNQFSLTSIADEDLSTMTLAHIN